MRLSLVPSLTADITSLTADITIHKCVPFGDKEEAKDHGVRTANICTNKRMAKAPKNIRQHNELDISILKQVTYYKYCGSPCTAPPQTA